MSLPRDFTVNGLGRIGITIRNQEGFEPLQENSLEFTGVRHSTIIPTLPSHF
jgi:hypothetical protein